MSLFKESVEVKDLKTTIERLEKTLWTMQQEREIVADRWKLRIEETKIEIRKEMEQALITSDLRRVEAVASLKAYKEMDNKDDRKQMRVMLGDAIKSLGKSPNIVVK